MTYLVPTNRYVYFHVRNDTGSVFYVGKGCGDRLFHTRSRNHKWRTTVDVAGGFTAVKVIDGLTDAEAYECEREIIAKIRENVVLCNLVAGGKGGLSPSAETREKQRAAKLGRKLSDEHKEKLANARNRRKTYGGWKLTPEQCAKRSENLRKRKVSAETGRKISEAKLGHIVSDETRLKISKTKRGVSWTPARRLAQEQRKVKNVHVS